MTRVQLCAVSIFLFACKHGGTTPPTTTNGGAADSSAPSDAAKQTVDATGPIVAVRQAPIPLTTYEWRIDPSGQFIAAEFQDAQDGLLCGIWDIESGAYLRGIDTAAEEEAPDAVDPCVDWEGDPYETSARSADGQLQATLAGALVIDGPGDRTLQLSNCRTCEGVLAWAPSGHQLATSNGEILEIWDADSGQRIHSEALGLSGVSETLIGWSEDGIAVAAIRDFSGSCAEFDDADYCEMYVDYEAYDEDEDDPDSGGEEVVVDGVALSSFFWPADGGPTVVDRDRFMSFEPFDVTADEGLRWLTFAIEHGYDRDGVSTTLHVLGTNDQVSELDDLEFDESDEDYLEAWNGHWRVDTVTQWLESWTRGEMYSGVALGWTAIVTEPEPAMYTATVVEQEEGVSGELELLGASGGVGVSRWESCNDYEEGCESGGPAVGDCELLDVAPQLSLVLVDCDEGLRLIEASGRGNTFAKLRFDSTAEWQWGRGNYLALVDPGTKLAVVDLATGKPLYERAKVEALLSIPLGPEQDRLALVYADRLEIVEGLTGAKVIAVAGSWDAAALSPDGQSLAVLANKRAKVIDIASGAERSSFVVDDKFGLAWRQDGAALFYGYDWPTHAVDPNTGALLYELDDPILDLLELEEVDPSWRWIHRPDGSVVRTLDFAQIELGPTWVRIASGQFDGKLEDLPDNLRFRVGADPSAMPRYTAKDLEPWLRVPSLAALFFSGAKLPTPEVPADAKAQR